MFHYINVIRGWFGRLSSEHWAVYLCQVYMCFSHYVGGGRESGRICTRPPVTAPGKARGGSTQPYLSLASSLAVFCIPITCSARMHALLSEYFFGKQRDIITFLSNVRIVLRVYDLVLFR